MIQKTRFAPLFLCATLALASPRDSRRAFADAAADSSAAFSGARPHLVLPPGPIQASDEFQYSVRIRVVNGMDRGIYLDSLGLDITDIYVASRRKGQTWSFNVTKVAEILPSVSPNDSGYVTFEGPAYSEWARLTMRLHCHMGDGRAITTPDASVDMSPPSVSMRHPQLFLDTPKGKIEYSLVPQVWGGRLSAAVLLIHGEDAQSRDWLPMAWNLANHGFSCMLMSLPGYGLSDGPPDFAGPRSLEAAGRVLDRLRRSPNVDSTRIAIWGVSEGATVASLLSAKRKDVGAVILQSGIYDLAATFQATESKEMRRILETEAGPKGGWKARSPLTSKALPAAPVLILHGGDDRVVPPEQARSYAAALRQKGRPVSLELFPADGHRLPIVASRDTVLSFLRARFAVPPHTP